MAKNTVFKAPTLRYTHRPLTAKDRHKLRYRWHRPIFLFSAIITFVALFLIALLLGLFATFPEIMALFSAEELGELQDTALLVLGLPFGLFVLRMINSVKPRSYGFMAGSGQFSQAAQFVEYYAKLAGLSKTPSLVVVTGNAPISQAFSGMIALHSDLFNAPRINGDCAAMRFAIAREIGHIAAGHRKFFYHLLSTSTQSIPYFSGFLTRAEEYTADNYGAVLAPDGAADYFAVLAVSKDTFQESCMYDVVRRAGTGGVPELVAAWSQPAPPITWRVRTMTEYGLFLLKTAIDCPDNPITYQEKTGRMWRIDVASLPLHAGRPYFWVAPKPIAPQRLDKLCSRLLLSEWIDKQVETAE